MRHKASSGSGKIDNSMQILTIKVQQALNRHAGFNVL
jgi:hypothetical protein